MPEVGIGQHLTQKAQRFVFAKAIRFGQVFAEDPFWHELVSADRDRVAGAPVNVAGIPVDIRQAGHPADICYALW